jgi:hypothetical protein
MIDKNELKDFIVHKQIAIARNALEHYSSVETRWIDSSGKELSTSRDTSYLANKSVAIMNTLDEVLSKVEELDKHE